MGSIENIPQASGIHTKNADGTLTKINLSVVYIKVLLVWLSKNIQSQTAEMVEIQAASAIYNITQKNLPRNYDGTGTPDSVFQSQKIIELNKGKIISVTFERFDWIRLGAKFYDRADGSMSATVGKAMINGILQSRSTTYQTYFAAEIAKQRLNITNRTGNVLDFPILNSQGELAIPEGTSTSDYLNQKLLLVFNIFVANIEGYVNSFYSGVDRETLTFEVSPKLYSIISSLYLLIGSDSGFRQIGDYKFTLLGNIPVKINALLGKNHMNEIDQDEKYDFSGVHGFIYHPEAMAFPFLPSFNNMTIDPNTGNPNFISRWMVAEDDVDLALRPELLFKVTLSNSSKNDLFKVIAKIQDSNVKQEEKKKIALQIEKGRKRLERRRKALEKKNKLLI